MKKAKPLAFKNVSARIKPHERQAIRRRAVAIGELVWASNYAQSAFCLAFAHLVSPKNFAVAFPIWNALASDAAQRDILKAVCDALGDKSEAPRIAWAIREANELISIRNDAAHTPLGTTMAPDGKGFLVTTSYAITEARLLRMATQSETGVILRFR